MQTIGEERLDLVADLFSGHRRRRRLIDYALEYRAATAIVDNETDPQVAALRVGRVTLLAGDVSNLHARELAACLSETIVTPEHQGWYDLIWAVHTGRATSYERIEFSSGMLDPHRLKAMAVGDNGNSRVDRLDQRLCERLARDVGTGFFGKFRSIDHFLEIGFGFCVIVDDRVVSGASTAVVCRRGISVQIETHNDHRRLGLATRVGASLILECLCRDIDPHWSAATPISASLAAKLGFSEQDTFEELVIPSWRTTSSADR